MLIESRERREKLASGRVPSVDLQRRVLRSQGWNRQLFQTRCEPTFRSENENGFAQSRQSEVISIPPADPAKREHHCLTDETKIWRKPSETLVPDTCGHDKFSKQTRLSRSIPLWGGVSRRGFATIVMHKKKKLAGPEWVGAITSGKVKKAIVKLKPSAARAPWRILCDNEGFMKSKLSMKAHRDSRIKLWHIPPRSPDLNPIEKFWAWLKNRLRKRDLRDMQEGRAALGKMAYASRVRNYCYSAAATNHAKKCVLGLRRVCLQVRKEKGGPTSG